MKIKAAIFLFHGDDADVAGEELFPLLHADNASKIAQAVNTQMTL